MPTFNQIVAAMNTRVAAWALSGVQDNAWRVHSTLVLPEGHTVTALDNKAGKLSPTCFISQKAQFLQGYSLSGLRGASLCIRWC